MIKLYPSSAGFADKDSEVVYTQYESACPKVVMLQQIGTRPNSIAPEAEQIGALFEDFVEDVYLKDVKFSKEVPFKTQIGDATISGSMDFVTEGPKTVHECKATFSSSTAREVIDLGQVKLNHLAQMSAYFVETKTTKGYLYVGRYQDSPEGLRCVKHRRFEIEVQPDGTLTVDGVLTPYPINAYLRWTKLVTQITQEKRIDSPRPVNPTQAWANPCRYCPYSAACDSVDKGEISSYDSFVSKCSELAKAVVVKPVKITKVRKGKA
jgi:hypothetical protein